METIHLNWTPLRPITDVPQELNSVPGVYVWGFDLQAERDQRISRDKLPSDHYLHDLSWRFIPFYVGIASNILQRMTYHSKNMVQGKYWVFHWDHLHNFKELQRTAAGEILDTSDWKVYSNTEANNALFDAIKPHAEKMRSAARFTCAPLPNSDDRMRRDIEALLCRNLHGYKRDETREIGGNPRRVRHAGDELVVGALEIVRRHAAASTGSELCWE